MIHSWLSARKINTFKTSGPKGKGRPLFKKHKMNDLQSRIQFSAYMDEEEGLFYISQRFSALTWILAVHQQMEGTGNYRAGICRTHSKEQDMTSSITVHRVHQATLNLASGIQQHKTNSSGYRSAAQSHLGRDRGILWQSDSDSSELGRADTTQHLLHTKQQALFSSCPQECYFWINAQPARCRMEIGFSLWEWGQLRSHQTDLSLPSDVLNHHLS